jgi:hypothetical protein
MKSKKSPSPSSTKKREAVGKRLRHYIQLKYLRKILRNGAITLVRNTKRWHDKNDVKLLDQYSKIENQPEVAVLCTTGVDETMHHWSVYGGSHFKRKMCIQFIRERLESDLKRWSLGERKRSKKTSLIIDQISYKNIKDLRASTLRSRDLLFTKRHQFEDENERRFVFVYPKKKTLIRIPISLDCIERIYTSPWRDQAEHERVKNIIINECLEGRYGKAPEIARCRLIDSDLWQKAALKRHMSK